MQYFIACMEMCFSVQKYLKYFCQMIFRDPFCPQFDICISPGFILWHRAQKTPQDFGSGIKRLSCGQVEGTGDFSYVSCTIAVFCHIT